MEVAIIETPIRFHLHGKASAVPNNCYGDVGLRLMDEMWKIVKESHTATSGINHWVSLSHGRMFVGVELLKNTQAPEELEPLEFELQRYLKHVHIGPYQALPKKWNALKTDLANCGETVGSPSLEIYGHHCDDPSKLETTILIGLQQKNA
jgi:predicted transcriptional regulator YdeE